MPLNSVPAEDDTEETHLLPVVARRPSLLAVVHEQTEVQTVELFSDLVAVVGIHSISDSLAEHRVERDDWIWFIIHVFFLWFIWHGLTIYANTSHTFTSGRFQIPEYCMILLTMATVVTMVQAAVAKQHKVAIGVAFVGRFILELGVICESHLRQAPWIDPGRKQLLKTFAVNLTFLLLIEILPFLIVGFFFSESLGDTFRFHGALGTIIIVLLQRRYFVLWKREQHHDTIHHEAIALEHIEERYELIVLIFFGELCFASAAAEDRLLSLSALGAAFGCYLHYFQARSEGERSGWDVSILSFINTQQLHIILFITVPAMGVGFVKQTQDESFDPRSVLVVSSSIFLAIMAGLEATCIDTTRLARVSVRVRALLQLFYAILLPFMAGLVWEHQVTLLVPLYLVLTGLFQIWCCQSVPSS